MKKEEVLRRSHNTFKKSDPYEIYLGTIGQLIGFAVALIVSTVIFIMQRFLQGEWNFALYATIPLLLAVKSAIVGIKLRKKKKIAEAIVIGTIAIALMVMHILPFFGV